MTSSQIPSRIAMPCPFGGFGSDNITPIKTVTGADINFPDGFPSAYGAPTDTSGKFVTRKEMNAIGNLASNDLFYHKCGGLNTFDAAFCAAVGGYPRGAILEYVAGTQIYNVMSLVDNNKVDFTGADHSSDGTGISTGTVDGISWTYCNKDAPSSQQNVIVASGDETGVTIDYQNGSIVSYFTSPANGMLTASIDLKYGDPNLQSGYGNCESNGYSTNIFISGGVFVRKIDTTESNISLTASDAKLWTCIMSASQDGLLRKSGTTAIGEDVSLYLWPRCYTLPTSNNPSYGSIRVRAGEQYAIGIVISPYVISGWKVLSGSYTKAIRYNGYSVNLSIL